MQFAGANEATEQLMDMLAASTAESIGLLSVPFFSNGNAGIKA